jgi:predicted RNA-binding protein with PIN domain
MTIHILIDGYNLIRNFPPLARVEKADFSQGREKLLDWLSQYRRKIPNPITVVFDGGKGDALAEGRDIYKGIKILYSSQGQTADDIIKRLVKKDGEKLLVVTSDQELGSYCRFFKAGWIRSEEFAHRIQEQILDLGQKPLKEDDPEDLPKKKKGSAFKLSKKAKRERKYWEHL